MIREVIPYKTEEEWLSLRDKDITSTDVSVLFGLSKYMVELELYHLKKSGARQAFEATDRMMFGKSLEPAIADIVENELDMPIIPLKTYHRIPELRMGTSCDFEVIAGKYENWLLEIKNVDAWIFKKTWGFENGEATDYIECQVQHQMEVTDRPGCIIAALVGGNEMHYIYRKRDREFGKAIVRRVRKFWSDIENCVEPEHDYENAAEYIIGLHQSAGDEVYDGRGDKDLTALVTSQHIIKGKIKTFEFAAESLKAEILDRIGDKCSKVLIDGYSLSCGMSKGSDDSVVTPGMVGDTIKGRKGSRSLRITKKKEKK